MARLNATVHIHKGDGEAEVFGPDDELPDWAVKAITNPNVWEEEPVEGSHPAARKSRSK